KAAKSSPLNLGNTFADENVSEEDVTITGVQQTDNYFFYENVDPDNVFVSLVLSDCWSWPEGSLSDDHMNSWIQILIRERAENDNWNVYMPINAGGVHWVTGAINLADSIFYVFDSMERESRMLMLEQLVRDWTPVINRILQMRGYFNGTGRQPHNFRFSYNDCFGYAVPQQQNAKDCGVITCWLITKSEDTENCGYD
ncbi:phospholipase-like protein, partial [Tanacetum coccineum]